MNNINSVIKVAVNFIGVICNSSILYMKLKRFRELSGRDYLIVKMAFLLIFNCAINIIHEINEYLYKFVPVNKYSCFIYFFMRIIAVNLIRQALIAFLLLLICCRNLTKSFVLKIIALVWIISLFITITNFIVLEMTEIQDYCVFNIIPGTQWIVKLKYYFEYLVLISIFLLIIVSIVMKREELKKKELLLYLIIYGFYISFINAYYEFMDFFAHDNFEIHNKISDIFLLFDGIIHAFAYFYVDQIMFKRILIFLKIRPENHATISANNIANDIDRNLNV